MNGAKHTVQVEHAKAEQTPKKLTGTRLFEGLVLFLQPSVFSFYVLKLGVGSCPVTSCGIGALGGISDVKFGSLWPTTQRLSAKPQSLPLSLSPLMPTQMDCTGREGEADVEARAVFYCRSRRHCLLDVILVS